MRQTIPMHSAPATAMGGARDLRTIIARTILTVAQLTVITALSSRPVLNSLRPGPTARILVMTMTVKATADEIGPTAVKAMTRSLRTTVLPAAGNALTLEDSVSYSACKKGRKPRGHMYSVGLPSRARQCGPGWLSIGSGRKPDFRFAFGRVTGEERKALLTGSALRQRSPRSRRRGRRSPAPGAASASKASPRKRRPRRRRRSA